MSEDKLLWKIQKYLLTKGFNANANQIKQGFLKKNRDWSDLRGEPITIADDFVDKINENLPIMFE
jgi:hypothetical protein